MQGSFPGMLTTRGYELRLPADWPPASVTINGAPVRQAGPLGKGGWSFQGNTLTTIIPVDRHSVRDKVTIVVQRATGLTARRSELDGFAGTMTRLRGAYDAMNQTQPVANPPDALVDAMQTGDRIGYHPERIQQELAHLRQVLPQAQAAVESINSTFPAHLEENIRRYSPQRWVAGSLDMDALKKSRTDAMARAEKLVHASANEQ